MHEVSLCQSLRRQIESVLQEYPGKRVSRVVLQIGALAGVESSLLRHAFPQVMAGSAIAGAKLDIEESGLEVYCPACGQRSFVSTNDLACRQCGHLNTRLLSGDQMLLKNIELEDQPQEEIHHV